MLHQACDVKLCHPNSEKQYKPPKLESRLSHQLQRSFLFHVNMIDICSHMFSFSDHPRIPRFFLSSKDFPTTRSLDSPGLTSSKISDPKGDGGAHLETDSGEALEMEDLYGFMANST